MADLVFLVGSATLAHRRQTLLSSGVRLVTECQVLVEFVHAGDCSSQVTAAPSLHRSVPFWDASPMSSYLLPVLKRIRKTGFPVKFSDF